jgi:hypothetical protein
MSWNFSFRAPDKDRAHELLNSQANVPQKWKDALGDAIEGIPDDHEIDVQSTGHITVPPAEGGSNGTFSVTPVPPATLDTSRGTK